MGTLVHRAIGCRVFLAEIIATLACRQGIFRKIACLHSLAAGLGIGIRKIKEMLADHVPVRELVHIKADAIRDARQHLAAIIGDTPQERLILRDHRLARHEIGDAANP